MKLMWVECEQSDIFIFQGAEESSYDDSNRAPPVILFHPHVTRSVFCVMMINISHISCFVRSFCEP